MPRSFMSWVHFAISSLTNLAKRSGELPAGSAPMESIFCFTSASASTLLASSEIFVTRSFGVPAGANSPNQPIAS